MRPLPLLVLLSLSAAAAPLDVTLRAADGITVYGRHSPVAQPRAVVLLFHQAGSNLHEYDPVTPRLNAARYATLAIDQRAGGTMFGAKNRTAPGDPYAAEEDALPDLQAAVDWAARSYPKLPVFALGSSYSAMLLFTLAQKNPNLAGIAAFSPADYLGDGQVILAARTLKLPVFATSSGDTAEQRRMDTVLQAVPAAQVTRFQPTAPGVHGASSLRPDRNAATAPQYWAALLAFLKAHIR